MILIIMIGPCGDHWDPDPVDDKTEARPYLLYNYYTLT